MAWSPDITAPGRKDTATHYDQIALQYARHRQVHPEVLARLLSTSGIDPASRVLEVGCGTGNYIRSVAEAGCSCWAIDPSIEMLAAAAEMPDSVFCWPMQNISPGRLPPSTWSSQ